MGTMACYQETCPHCGRVPPSRQKEIKKYQENLAFLQNEVKYISYNLKYQVNVDIVIHNTCHNQIAVFLLKHKSATNWQQENGHSKYSTFGSKDDTRGVVNKSFMLND